MFLRYLAMTGTLLLATPAAYAATNAGNANAGRDLVLRSCTSCHAVNETIKASDGAPPLSFIARDNKQRPAWIRGWLMDPHPPMPGIMLSRQQINDIIAYLDSLPVQQVE
jgi:cytochrome c